MRIFRKWFSVVLAVSVILPMGVWEPNQAEAANAGIQVNPITNIEARPDYIRGVDISMLKEIEEGGGVFFEDGEQKDLLQILKEHGVNWIRLRTWVDPYDANGNPLGGGTNDKATTIELAKRSKAMGFKLLLDFHYSDFWTDPGEQEKPKAWHDLSGAALEQALYDYTADMLQLLIAENAAPDMVQVGNETNGGMVWPDGKTWKETDQEVIGGYDGWVGLINQGTAAVRAHLPDAKIIIHLANGGTNDLYRHVFDELTARHVDFDVIGLSYYPYWHGTLDDLQSNMNDISVRYDKEVAVVETAYAYTLENGDSHGNLFGATEATAGGYKATLQGQATAVRDVMNAVAQVPDNKGLGVFYWEPAWIPLEGVGWKAGEGNAWDNQAMFDFDGNMLPTLDVFDFGSDLYRSQPTAAQISSIQPVSLKMNVGEAPVLPASVKAEYTDDSIKDIAVEWADISEDRLNQPGTFTLLGSVQGTDLKAEAIITVQGMTNYVQNFGFETGDFSDWTITGDLDGIGVKWSPGADSYEGDYSLHYWLDRPFSFTAEQKLTGLPDGNYTLRAVTHGGGGENAIQIYAACGSGEKRIANAVNKGWQQWQRPDITNIEVTGGECTIGIHVDGNSGNWGDIDQVEFFRNTQELTLSAPTEVIASEEFTVELGVKRLSQLVYAQDITLHYDPSVFEWMGAEGIHPSVLMTKATQLTDGSIRVITAHDPGLAAEGNTVQLKFKAKNAVSSVGYGAIKVVKAEWGTAPGGIVLNPAYMGSAAVTVKAKNEDSIGPSDQPVYSPGESGGTETKDEPEIALDEGGAVSIVLTPQYNEAAKSALVKVDEALLQRMIDLSASSEHDEHIILLEVTASEGATAYQIELPAKSLEFDPSLKLELRTALGTLRITAKSLLGEAALEANSVTLEIRRPDLATLGASLQERIGDRPVVEIRMLAGEKQVEWNDSELSISMTIPYEPKTQERGKLHLIVAGTIHSDGTFTAIPSSIYNPEAEGIAVAIGEPGMFAVAFADVAFADTASAPWAQHAIEALAAREVVAGIGESQFAPRKAVTRADFVMMLMKTLGFSAVAETGFSDVAPSDYYFEAVTTAKALGIANGADGLQFDPKAEITREQMMQFMYRAMQLKGIQSTASEEALSSYSDASDISSYAAEAAAVLVSDGFIFGYDGKLNPKAGASRAEAAAILYRLLFKTHS